MTLTPDEARGALADIDQVSKKMRNTLAAGDLGPNLMIWGAMWAAGFTCSYFWPNHTGLIWGSLCALGFLCTVTVGIRQFRKRLVLSEAERRLGKKMALFWLTVFGYAIGLLLLLKPTDGRDFVMVFVLFAMMAYILMGLWLGSRALAVVGLIVTIAATIGRVFLPMEPFLIWMAVFGGGGLFIPGLYVQWRWR